MFELFAQLSAETIQSFLDIEVGMGLSLGSILVITLASTLGLPLLSPTVRTKVGLQKKPKSNEESDS